MVEVDAFIDWNINLTCKGNAMGKMSLCVDKDFFCSIDYCESFACVKELHWITCHTELILKK